MTERPGASEAVVCGFPAPGSRVPGAPPPLKRALTPADGVRYTAAQDRTDEATMVAGPADPATRRASRSSFTIAAAMAGIAVGLELARLSSRGRVRCYLRQVNTIG